MAAAKVANVGTTGEIWSVVIADTATESDELATGGMVVWGVLISGAWTTANAIAHASNTDALRWTRRTLDE